MPLNYYFRTTRSHIYRFNACVAPAKLFERGLFHSWLTSFFLFSLLWTREDSNSESRLCNFCFPSAWQVNLKHGIWGPETRTGTETDTCTACAGTIILEFAALSRFTGDPVFEVHSCIRVGPPNILITSTTSFLFTNVSPSWPLWSLWV